ncbi:MAG: hypothetical protein EXR84_01560 [Gammaproteobacteria bacterium]|nr:hypothetical protein [Gammaproteobacteria bacterium]
MTAHSPVFAKMLPLLLASCLLPGITGAQQIELSQQSWSAEVIRPRGQPVVPLFDGWFTNADGTRTLCYSFFNLNTEQSLSIPTGADNYLNDARFEAMLPTHFDPLPPAYRHKFCVFTITVPADFRRDETIEWHLTSANQQLSVPGHILPEFMLDEPASDGRQDLAPLIKLAPDAAGVRGRKGMVNSHTLHGKTGQPVELQAWVEHPNAQVWIGWAKHSGPGQVEFSALEYTTATGATPFTTQATFAEAGSYVIRLQSIDDVDAFEYYCCHTNIYFPVEISH